MRGPSEAGRTCAGGSRLTITEVSVAALSEDGGFDDVDESRPRRRRSSPRSTSSRRGRCEPPGQYPRSARSLAARSTTRHHLSPAHHRRRLALRWRRRRPATHQHRRPLRYQRPPPRRGTLPTVHNGPHRHLLVAGSWGDLLFLWSPARPGRCAGAYTATQCRQHVADQLRPDHICAGRPSRGVPPAVFRMMCQ